MQIKIYNFHTLVELMKPMFLGFPELRRTGVKNGCSIKMVQILDNNFSSPLL